MKILLDENLSFKLKMKLRPLFPNLIHVSDANLLGFDDAKVFDFARKNSYDAIITSDEDYYWLSLMKGIPPKIIWLRVGNMTTDNLVLILTAKKVEIDSFLNDTVEICLEIK
jgi:predicted nuclease of predicted toxin-antitoxin system